MATLFCAPMAFTVAASSAIATAQASNLALDFPGMVYRSIAVAPAFVTVLVSGQWDTLALAGTNLRATDTIRVRAASSEANTTTAPTFDQTVVAWSGVAPAAGALSLLTLPNPRSEPFIRIDITSTGNPAGFVEVQRLCIGKRFENPGLDIGAERTMEDTSSVDEGLGYTAINRYNVRVGWKLTISGIKEAAYEAVWHPFARAMGNSRSFLFVEDDAPAYLQNRAAMCRFIGSAKGAAQSSDYYVIDATLKSTV